MHQVKIIGEAKKARDRLGRLIERQESIFIEEWGVFLRCIPYDNHFIYKTDFRRRGESSFMCTCGSMAVIAPPSPHGFLVCHFHMTYGVHQTSVINTKDFASKAADAANGEVLRAKGKKWLL